MPTATFFRLPKEKRERLMQASWTEVSRVRFSEISINRIITAAHIPRGSFYQYFEDKEDLIRYLLEDMREYFISLMRSILLDAEGDLFVLPLMAYDRFMAPNGDTDPMLTQVIHILTLNQGMDIQSFISGSQPQAFLPDQLWEAVDPGKLRSESRDFAEHVFHLACAVLAFAVADTLCRGGDAARARETIQTRMDLLRRGGASCKEGTT